MFGQEVRDKIESDDIDTIKGYICHCPWDSSAIESMKAIAFEVDVRTEEIVYHVVNFDSPNSYIFKETYGYIDDAIACFNEIQKDTRNIFREKQ